MAPDALLGSRFFSRSGAIQNPNLQRALITYIANAAGARDRDYACSRCSIEGPPSLCTFAAFHLHVRHSERTSPARTTKHRTLALPSAHVSRSDCAITDLPVSARKTDRSGSWNESRRRRGDTPNIPVNIPPLESATFLDSLYIRSDDTKPLSLSPSRPLIVVHA
jgi:hypothetical protein